MLTRRQTILAKIESTYGTNPTPVDTDAIEVSNVQWKNNAEVLERDILKDTMSKDKHVMGMIDAEVSFDVEIKGSGSAGTAPQIGKLLRACGLSETVDAGVSVTYAPESDESNHASVTIYVYKDGTLRKLTGARGDLSIDIQAGRYGKASFTFKGMWNSVTDASIVTPDAPDEAISPAIVESSSFSWGGYAPVASAVSFALQNVLSRRESVNSANKGVHSIRIADRSPVGSFNADAVVEATHPFWSDFENATARAITITLGSSAGNICTIAGPQCALESIEDGDDEGVMLYSLGFKLYKNASAGDDELTIAFT